MNNRTFQRSLRVKGAYYYRNDCGMVDLCTDLRWDEEVYVKLVPEPTNRHDPNAIRFMYQDSLIGFVAKEHTESIHLLIRKFGLQNVKATITRSKASFSDYMIYASVFVEGAREMDESELHDEEDDEYVPKSLTPAHDYMETMERMEKLNALVKDSDRPMMARVRARAELQNLEIHAAKMKKLVGVDLQAAIKKEAVRKSEQRHKDAWGEGVAEYKANRPKNLCMEVPEPKTLPKVDISDMQARYEGELKEAAMTNAGTTDFDLLLQKAFPKREAKPQKVIDPITFLDVAAKPAPKSKPVMDDFL